MWAIGRATGPHLHYEVRVHNVPVNPTSICAPPMSRPMLGQNFSAIARQVIRSMLRRKSGSHREPLSLLLASSLRIRRAIVVCVTCGLSLRRRLDVRFRCVVSFLASLSLFRLLRRTAQPDVQTAFARAQHLKHGINASHWFSQNASDYSAAPHRHARPRREDIALMAKLGFDNVRLSIDPAPLEQNPLGAEG